MSSPPPSSFHRAHSVPCIVTYFSPLNTLWSRYPSWSYRWKHIEVSPTCLRLVTGQTEPRFWPVWICLTPESVFQIILLHICWVSEEKMNNGTQVSASWVSAMGIKSLRGQGTLSPTIYIWQQCPSWKRLQCVDDVGTPKRWDSHFPGTMLFQHVICKAAPLFYDSVIILLLTPIEH
jgi:hypothetical protein